MKNNSTLGKRKRNDNPVRHVHMKYSDIEKDMSVGVGKNGNAEKHDEFSLSFDDKDTEYRLSLTRADALRVVKFWINSGKLDLINE